MRYLNLGAGATRPKEPWINLDNLYETLLPGTPERAALDSESNYVNWDISYGELPFEEGSFRGILSSHCIEHFDCIRGVEIMKECHRILEPGGRLIVSVPDASYFRKVHAEDNIQNAIELFGEPIHEPDGEKTFFGYALWNRYHKAILNEDTLWAYFIRAGFKIPPAIVMDSELQDMWVYLNRLKFSLIKVGVK